MAGKKRTNKKGGNAKKKKTPPSTHQNDATISSSKAASNGGKPVCRFLLEGKCNRGDDCKFLHSPEACAAGARAQCLREGKSEDDAEMAASVAFQVAEKKREMKKNAAASEKQTNDAVSAHPKAGALKDQPPQSEREVEAVNQTKKDEPNKELLKNGKPKQEESNDESSVLPSGLESSMSEFTAAQQEIAKKLCHLPGSKNQRHLFEEWSTSPSDVPKKKAFMEKLESIDKSYPDGGLIGYLTNAVALLEKSKKGENPLEGWVPSVPKGEAFEIGTEEFLETEKLGLEEVGRCGFVLVAGGLGERLGYSGIKIGLPTELATETPYIQFYIETILAFQSRYATPGQKLPLCIMTSGDTNDKTVTLLKANNYFGMTEDQITIVQQGIGVPALYDNDAHIALVDDDPYDIQMKPHGHGDIHALLHSHGVAKTWSGQGIKWTVFFQDTNGLAFHTLALSLGVSSKMGLIMNSITCPRKAKQAIGAITKLSKGDQERTINVEYNQLDPLLRATGYPDGDVNDDTGFSPFPGNINQLLFRLDDYVKVLERTKGVMPEFVNPKYKDAEKTIFKKPTRLECMMQDFPTVLEGLETAKVGFTSLASELCFSPVKNATSDGVALQKGGTHPGVAATGEADQNAAARRILRSIGCNVEEGFDATFSGINVVSGPDCVLKPSFAACSNELKKKFPNPSTIKISGKSSLVLSGDGLVIESLDLDGALIVECEDGASGVIRDLTVKNRGWVKVSDERSDNEVIRMRGYHMNKLETEKIVFKRDGSIEGNYPPKVEAIEPELVTNVPEPVSIAVPVPVKMEELEQKPAPVIEPASVAEPKQAQCLTSKSAEPVSVPEAKPESAISNHVQGTSQKEAPQSIMSSAPVPTLSLEPTPTAMETPTDLSKPASSESNDSDQLCGGCTIL